MWIIQSKNFDLKLVKKRFTSCRKKCTALNVSNYSKKYPKMVLWRNRIEKPIRVAFCVRFLVSNKGDFNNSVIELI